MLVTLKFGLAIMNDFPPDVVPADRIAAMREQVRAARDAGISSIWVLQHYLGNMPTLQPVPILSALAQEAGDMTLGTNMFILPLHHPVQVAEDFATLDHITGGRVIAGFGMGYRENEFASFGIPLEERVTRFEESVTLIRQLWSGERVTFEGQHYSVKDQHISLKPVQEGGPQIWIGAGPHKKGAQRAARLGDAWIVPPHASPEKLKVVLGHYKEERERLGRGPSELVVRRHLTTEQAAVEVADASYLFTNQEGAVQALKQLEEQGLTYIVLRAQWYDTPQEQVLRTLELFKNEVLPAFR